MVCFNAVAAAEDMDADAVGAENGNLAVENNSAVENNGDAELSAVNSDESLQAGESGSFSDLQDLINSNYGSAIDLDKDYVYSGGSDSPWVTIKNQITINGNNHKISGNDQTWLLYLTENAENVMLNNISFVHAKGSQSVYIMGWKSTFANCTFENNDVDWGVYISSYAEKITFSDSVFSNNDAYYSNIVIDGYNNVIEHTVFEDNQAVFGGAIFLRGSNNLIYDSVFRNNVADYVGGAIYCTGSNNIVNKSTFNKNKCSNYYGSSRGGAINWEGDNGLIINSEFNENSASQGGAVSWLAEDGKIVNSTFNKNSAEDAGAVYWSGKNGKVTDSQFNENTADRSGAMYVISNAEIDNCAFSKNNAVYQAGALFIANNVIVSNSEFNNNHASEIAGAIFVSGCNNTIEGSSFNENDAAKGGAINVDLTSASSFENCNNTIHDSTFSKNTAEEGGAVWVYDECDITDSTFSENVAQKNAGAVYYGVYSKGSIMDSTFTNNKATSGGAVYSYEDGGVISDSTFENNEADYGGAVYWSGNNGKLLDSNFINNHAVYDAGAVYTYAMNFLINNSSFKENKAANAGAVAIYGINNVISNSKFDDNDVNGEAGAVLIRNHNAVISDSSFTKNDAQGDGGAICLHADNGKLYNSTFSENYGGIGGALHISGSNHVINKTTFSDNSAFFSGAAISLNYASANIDDSKFIRNHAYQGGAIYWHYEYNGLSVLNNSYFEDNFADYGGGAISCEYEYGDRATKIIDNTEFVNNKATNYGGAVAALETEIRNSIFEGNKANIGGAVYSYNSKISDSQFENNNANYGNDIYGHYYSLINSNVPEENQVKVTPSEIVRITGDIPQAYSVRSTNTSYIAICAERFAYYPNVGALDYTLRGLINIKTGEDISEYLKILAYYYFNSTDDLYPQEGDTFIDEYGYPTTRPNYYSEAVHVFSDFDFRTSNHPVVKKVLELYDSGFRVSNNDVKKVGDGYIQYNFTSLIAPCSQTMFLFKTQPAIPSMSVNKTSLTPQVEVGMLAFFIINVTNNGTCDLNNLNVSEINSEGIQYQTFDESNGKWKFVGTMEHPKWQHVGTLAPGEHAELLVVYLTLREGSYTNVVVVNNNVTTSGDQDDVEILNSSLKVEKISLTPKVPVGELTSFKIRVTNNGQTELKDVYVKELNYEGLVYDHFTSQSGKWSYDGKNKWTYDGILVEGEKSEFTVFFKTVKAGNFTNIVAAGSNATNETTSENVTEAFENNTNKTTPEVPENSTVISKNNTDFKNITNDTLDVLKNPETNVDLRRATGNPVFALLAVLLAVSVFRIRKFKK